MWTKKAKLATLILSVLVLSFLMIAIGLGVGGLPQIVQMIIYLALPITGGVISFSFCSVLGTLTHAENATSSNVLNSIGADRERNFLVGFLFVTYFVDIRPSLATVLSFLPYVEWMTLALGVYVLFSMMRISAKEIQVDSETQSWRSHVQDTKRETGRDLARVTSVMEQFVEHGVKEPLLVYLTLHLQRLGKTEEEILYTLGPLISSQLGTKKSRWSFFASPSKRRKLDAQSKRAREDLLKKLLEVIDRL